MVAKRAQHVAPNNVAICCVYMLQSFGWDFSVKGRLMPELSLQLDFSSTRKFVVLYLGAYEAARMH